MPWLSLCLAYENFRLCSKMIRKIILTVLLGLLLTSTSISAKDWSKIRIVTEGAYPPFNYVNKDGELEGFEIDLITVFCEELKADCTLSAQDWDGIFPKGALLARKYDAVIASVSITEERKKGFIFRENDRNNQIYVFLVFYRFFVAAELQKPNLLLPDF